jgi:hypothetical protein
MSLPEPDPGIVLILVYFAVTVLTALSVAGCL